MLGLVDISDLLPKPLRERFESDPDIVPRLIPALNRFNLWFESSGVPFFKSYTDHSSQHSLDVFRTGASFLSERAVDTVSVRDVAVFAAACFCHDAGMHLTELHFIRLIANNDIPLTSFDTRSWKQLWMEFTEDSKRWNSRKRIEVFGTDDDFSSPPSDPMDFTDKHRLLIGEFLRENHPRLGHDLALGLDTYLGLDQLLPLFENEERDIIGLVARSHGFPIRSFFEYINTSYHIRDFCGAHIVFIMCLLGIADYAQIDAYRAPKARLKMILVGSPKSQREWRVHQSVRNITPLHDDPECFYVDANPGMVEDYLRLEGWLRGIQQSLDTSWAILGEIYGRFTKEGLDNLSLNVRRVRSSIFEAPENFNFVPEKIRFSVAETEMLTLLLEPLYGDHPGYGVRELVQNAVDAVREAKSLTVPHLNSGTSEVVIELSISHGVGLLKVQDAGVGMTLDTIKNYFLNAGASFRTSSEWKKEFVDSEGKIEVVRSGRFGVGALAAFIIGPTLTVETRHYDQTQTWSFSASLHDENIDVRNTSSINGTKIEVCVAQGKLGVLKEFLVNAERFLSFLTCLLRFRLSKMER